MSNPASFDESSDSPRFAPPDYVVAFRRASAPFQWLQMARRRQTSAGKMHRYTAFNKTGARKG